MQSSTTTVTNTKKRMTTCCGPCCVCMSVFSTILIIVAIQVDLLIMWKYDVTFEKESLITNNMIQYHQFTYFTYFTSNQLMIVSAKYDYTDFGVLSTEPEFNVDKIETGDYKYSYICDINGYDIDYTLTSLTDSTSHGYNQTYLNSTYDNYNTEENNGIIDTSYGCDLELRGKEWIELSISALGLSIFTILFGCFQQCVCFDSIRDKCNNKCCNTWIKWNFGKWIHVTLCLMSGVLSMVAYDAFIANNPVFDFDDELPAPGISQYYIANDYINDEWNISYNNITLVSISTWLVIAAGISYLIIGMCFCCIPARDFKNINTVTTVTSSSVQPAPVTVSAVATAPQV